ncbi:LacI family DNA-binding transcriptional regulator [Streptomyces thermocarboxydus]
MAARAGVSRATVSRVVNGSDGVREPWPNASGARWTNSATSPTRPLAASSPGATTPSPSSWPSRRPGSSPTRSSPGSCAASARNSPPTTTSWSCCSPRTATITRASPATWPADTSTARWCSPCTSTTRCPD